MAWTELTRRQHDRKGNKYASDTTDPEWALIAPMMPGMTQMRSDCPPRTPASGAKWGSESRASEDGVSGASEEGTSGASEDEASGTSDEG